MKIRLASLLKVTGHHSQVVVYGLNSCLYTVVHQELETSGHEAYLAFGGKGCLDKELTDSDIIGRFNGISKTTQFCKATITNLAFINYQLYKLGKPLIPLVFCVGLETSFFNKKGIDAGRVARSSGMLSSITDSELRRCYKIFSELGPDFAAVAEQTFKFVKLIRVSSNPTEFDVKQVKPVWEHPDWNALWMKREDRKMQSPVNLKKNLWREMLAMKVMLFHCGKIELNVEKISAPVKLKSRL